jgi:hypothetical protein
MYGKADVTVNIQLTIFEDGRGDQGGRVKPEGLEFFLGTHASGVVCTILQPCQMTEQYFKGFPRAFWPGFVDNKNISDIPNVMIYEDKNAMFYHGHSYDLLVCGKERTVLKEKKLNMLFLSGVFFCLCPV